MLTGNSHENDDSLAISRIPAPSTIPASSNIPAAPGTQQSPIFTPSGTWSSVRPSNCPLQRID